MLDDCSIVPNDIKKFKKIFLELISHTKILNIKFYSMKLSMTKILLNLQGGLDKGGGDWKTSNTVSEDKKMQFR